MNLPPPPHQTITTTISGTHYTTDKIRNAKTGRPKAVYRLTAYGLAIWCQRLKCAPIRDMAIAFMTEKGMAHMRKESRAPQAAAPAFAPPPVDHTEVDDEASSPEEDMPEYDTDATMPRSSPGPEKPSTLPRRKATASSATTTGRKRSTCSSDRSTG
jgi:hypothetical protein